MRVRLDARRASFAQKSLRESVVTVSCAQATGKATARDFHNVAAGSSLSSVSVSVQRVQLLVYLLHLTLRKK